MRIIAAALIGIAAVSVAAEKVSLKTENDRISYSIGVDIGKNFHDQDIKVNTNSLVAGIKDGLKAQTTLLSEDEIKQTLMNFQQSMLDKRAAEFAQVAEKNKAEGEAFLAENKTKEGVVTLNSGLQYKVQRAGSGSSPKVDDLVTTHYRGRLIDGTEFDSSYKRGEPVQFPVNGVIPGWTEALQLMKPGAKWELFVPSELAYGEYGAGRVIGPNATLIFEVELISVDQAQAS